MVREVERLKDTARMVGESAASVPMVLMILALRQAEHYLTRYRVRFSWIPRAKADAIVRSLDKDELVGIVNRNAAEEDGETRVVMLDLRNGEVRPMVFLSEEHRRDKAHLFVLAYADAESPSSLRTTSASELSDLYYQPSLQEMWRYRR